MKLGSFCVGGGEGVGVSCGGISVSGGGVAVSGGGVAVSAGGVAVSGGGVAVSSGGVAVSGGGGAAALTTGTSGGEMVTSAGATSVEVDETVWIRGMHCLRGDLLAAGRDGVTSLGEAARAAMARRL